MPLNLLLAWWNLIYVLPFALALTYLGLFVFTGITFGDVDADVDMDADTSVHVEAHVADVHTGPELHAGPDADADVDGDHDAGMSRGGLVHAPAVPAVLMPHMAQGASVDHEAANAAPSPFLAFLTLLGVGKVPVSLALMILLMSWGLVGFALNALFVQWIGATGFVTVISLPLTLVISLTLTGLCAAAIAKIIPSDEGTRERRQDLVGKPGEAMFEITASFGMAKVRGNAGDFYQVPCRTVAGKPPIAKGTRIVLFDYDRQDNVFTVAPFDA
jgi:membrane protein implicated in regulation of membrane protease activity